jgi:hypothetical protein
MDMGQEQLGAADGDLGLIPFRLPVMPRLLIKNPAMPSHRS